MSENAADSRQMQEALRECGQCFRALAENLASVFWMYDAWGCRLLYVNHAYERVWGRSRKALYQAPDEWLEAIHVADRPRVAEAYSKMTAGGRFNEEYQIVHTDGSVRWIRDIGFPIRNAAGRIYRIAKMAEDITEHKRLEEIVSHQPYYDVLTNLPNRKLFLDRLNQGLTRPLWHKRFVAVLMVDLDHFSRINDTLGHSFGDLLLKMVAQRLRACLREGDTVARVGGDEFAIILADVAKIQDVPAITEKVLKIFSDPFRLKGHEFYLFASAGVSVFPDDAQTSEALLDHADVALHRAKSQGGNKYQNYSPAMNARVFERVLMESNLHHALERGEFTLYYQPQFSLASGRITGMEALIRWQHPELGLIFPGKFIPVAEEIGLMPKIGEWGLRTACVQNKAWQNSGLPPVRMAVNVSPLQLQQKHLAQIVACLLVETGLDPRWLEIELTESSIMDSAESVIETLRELNATGVKISIDDFGTGYSSFRYLKRFPISKLKIDPSFIHDVATDPDSEKIVKAIVTLAHNLSLKVTAEGIETAGQLEFLRAIGCDEFQGYLYSYPLPATEATELLTKKKGL